MHALSCRRCYYRVDRRDISLLRFILEAYDGVATVTTIDSRQGIVMLTVAPGWEGLVKDLLAELSDGRDLYLEPLTAPPPAGQGDP
jgi:hypothetical protein